MAESTTTSAPANQAPPEAQAQATASHTVTGASQELGELFGALAKAQGEIRSARASSVGVVGRESSQTTFTYADLAEIWEACRAALSKSGLALLQRARVQNNGWVVIETILGHSSGQWIRSELPLLSCTSNGTQDSRPRTIGATISFGRRYGLAALVGVVQAEEETEQAQQRVGRQDQRHQQQKSAPAPATKTAAKPAGKAAAPTAKPAAAAPSSTPAAKPASAPTPAAAPDVDFDPETGVVREPPTGVPSDFDELLGELGKCASPADLEEWSQWNNEVLPRLKLSDAQLEQLRDAYKAKRAALAA